MIYHSFAHLGPIVRKNELYDLAFWTLQSRVFWCVVGDGGVVGADPLTSFEVVMYSVIKIVFEAMVLRSRKS